MVYNTARILDLVRKTLLPLPGAKEGLCYGMIAFFAHNKLICNIKHDGITMYLYHHDRDELISAEPAIYFITDHYKNLPSVLIRLPLIDETKLKELLMNAWLLRAGKTHLKAYYQLGR